MTKYGWNRHDGQSYAQQQIEDAENCLKLNVQWVKPDLDTDPNHWVLRVEGDVFYTSGTCQGLDIIDVYNDISLMWYVATPDDAFATFDTDHMTGSDDTHGSYFVSYNEPSTNKAASYVNG